MGGSYALSHTKNDKSTFVLKAENGQTVLTSQTYAAKKSALDGIESVKQNSADDSRYEWKESARGAAYFVLGAANSQVIGTSEEYSSTSAREAGIASIKRSSSNSRLAFLRALWNAFVARLEPASATILIH